jgi:hypothetical protein
MNCLMGHSPLMKNCHGIYGSISYNTTNSDDGNIENFRQAGVAALSCPAALKPFKIRVQIPGIDHPGLATPGRRWNGFSN